MLIRYFTQWVVAICVVAAILIYTNILDLLETFLMVFILPVLFLASLGFIGESSYEMVRLALSANTVGYFREKLNYYRGAHSADAEAEQAA